jgi:hypothetical protein
MIGPFIGFVIYPTRSRNQKDDLQLLEEPNPAGRNFIRWVLLAVGKSLCFFAKISLVT